MSIIEVAQATNQRREEFSSPNPFGARTGRKPVSDSEVTLGADIEVVDIFGFETAFGIVINLKRPPLDSGVFGGIGPT